MSFVKIKHVPVSKSFNNLMDDFFQNLPSIYSEDLNNGLNLSVPVNVIKKENGFDLEVVAPGFVKEDFKIHLEQNILTISAEKTSENEKKNDQFVSREYSFKKSFKRNFSLNEKIDSENVSARYENGVLYISLYNKEEVKAPVKQINIL